MTGTASCSRIEAIDLLRGVALLGILLVNIGNFAMPAIAQFNPTAYGEQSWLNESIHGLTFVLAEQKFMAIFSLLFGAGVVMLCRKHERTRMRPGWWHLTRLVWLLKFGLVHMFFIWGGDVLVVYACCGVVIYLFRKWRPAWQLVVGVAIFLIPVGLNAYVDTCLPLEPSRHARLQAVWQPTASRLSDELEVYRGSYLGQVKHRFGVTKRMRINAEQPSSESHRSTLFASWFTPMVGSVTRALGMMLVGMAMFSWGILSGTAPTRTYVCLATLGLGVGIPLAAYGYRENTLHDWRYEHAMFIGRNAQIVSTLFLSLGYTACVMLWSQPRCWFANFRHHLARVGRMSLTNYLLQSLLATTVFYGFGLGYFGYLSRLQQLGVVICIWCVQIGFSSWWLNRYRSGPLEWLWRCLTYWEVLALRK